MTKISRMAVFGALIVLGGAWHDAQATTNVAANVFLNVTITLNGVKSGEMGIEKVHISTVDVIDAIGSNTSHEFSAKAKLLLKIPVGLESGPSFIVRDILNRTNVVDFDVPSTILWMVQIGDSVDSSRTNITGIITGTQATIYEFTFQSSQGSFDVQGYTTSTLDNRGNPGEKLPETCPVTASSKVTGTGSDVDGDTVVLQGSISVSGRKVVKIR
jgi:hypothetical protein